MSNFARRQAESDRAPTFRCGDSGQAPTFNFRDCIDTPPAGTALGVAYMRNGIAEVTQNLTPDHALAAKALRLPVGSVEEPPGRGLPPRGEI
ncbi:MAG: hypothetical protein LAO21_22450 [Acidobacteriia bacterium]|nr:hypothetical protein [Terriglobia bacterium]